MNDSGGDSRYAAPQAHLEDRAAPARASGAPARRSTRLWAALVDVALGVALYFASLQLLPGGWFGTAGNGLLQPNWRNAALGFLGFALLHAYLLSTRGQTIGKALFRIRIVRPDGSRVSLARLLGLRYGVGSAANILPVLGQAFGLIDVLFIFRASRRCLHDLIADTVVVDA